MFSSPSSAINNSRLILSSSATTDFIAPKRLYVRGNSSLVQSGGRRAASSSHVDPINSFVRGSPRMLSSLLLNAMIPKGSTCISPLSSSISSLICIKLEEPTAASASHQQAQPGQLSSHVIIETVEYKDYIQQEHNETTQPNQKGVDETNYGEIIEFTNKYDGTSDQWIEHDQELFPLAKKPKIDSTQPNKAQAEVIDVSPRQPNVELHLEVQPNQENKQFITVHLECPQSNCPDTFAEGQLNQHMWEKHFIGPNRCLVKGCAQSFSNTHILSDHIKHAHEHTTQWNCNKCDKQFATYSLLSKHNTDYHQLGLFQCSFPVCTFIGQYRKKVKNHYYRQHKPKLNCQHSTCNYRASNPAHMKIHELTHSGIKPYRCKWAQCDYASAQRGNTIRHFRRNHFPPNLSSVPNGTQLGDPNDYVEVASV